MRMGYNMAIDMDSGDIHFISGWSDEAENKKKNRDEYGTSFNVYRTRLFIIGLHH